MKRKVSKAKQLRIERRKPLQPRYWVTMTDKALSGWGRAEGKANKFVIAVPDFEKAKIIERNARKRPEMKYINIRSTKPRYNKRYVLTSMRGFNELGDIWKK